MRELPELFSSILPFISTERHALRPRLRGPQQQLDMCLLSGFDSQPWLNPGSFCGVRKIRSRLRVRFRLRLQDRADHPPPLILISILISILILRSPPFFCPVSGSSFLVTYRQDLGRRLAVPRIRWFARWYPYSWSPCSAPPADRSPTFFSSAERRLSITFTTGKTADRAIPIMIQTNTASVGPGWRREKMFGASPKEIPPAKRRNIIIVNCRIAFFVVKPASIVVGERADHGSGASTVQ